jgi:hypothetical protein
MLWKTGPSLRARLAGGVGILLMPYFLPCSIFLYTDMPAVFFSVCGLWAYHRRHHAASALVFTLAIACRQYMIAWPLAIAIYHATRIVVDRRHGRGAPKPSAWQENIAPLLWTLLPAASLLGWVWLWHGWAPPGAIRGLGIGSASGPALQPDHCLYALAVIGAYYVPVEIVLLPGVWRWAGGRQALVVLVLAIVLAIAFVCYPPLGNPPGYAIPTMGYLDKALHAVLPTPGRVLVFYVLAVLAAARFFTGWSLATAMVLAATLLMAKTQVGWDKYMLPTIVLLWFERALRPVQSDTPPSSKLPEMRPLMMEGNK